MAFEAPKPSNGESSNSKLYTGVCEMKIKGVNLNQAEMQALGYKAENNPIYFKQGEYLRLAFLLEGIADDGTPIKAFATYFLKPKPRTDIWIDIFGNFKKDRTQLDEKSRNPLDGEIEIVNFFQNLFNLGKEDHAYFETTNVMAQSGDISEIKRMTELAKDQDCSVKVLLGVKEGKYQHVYTGKIERSWSNDLKYMHKQLVNDLPFIKDTEFGGINANMLVPADFKLKEYVKDSEANSATAPQPQAAAQGTAIQAPGGFGAPVAQAVQQIADIPVMGTESAFGTAPQFGATVAIDSEAPPF